MASILEGLLGSIRRTKVTPTETIGGMGRAVYGGFVQDNETSADLRGDSKYIQFSDMLANTSIVAAGVRYFLNLTANAEWNFEPADTPKGQEMADLCRELLTEDPKTSWPRIVRRAAMYRFYGFSVQEWTARRRDDGIITFADISPRAQKTIKRWDIDFETGDVIGMVQTVPQTQKEIYLPRIKTLYLVDDTLDDGPEGLGIFRHLAGPAKRLKRYEQLEGLGFEHDLRGIPIGRGPFTKLAEAVKAGTISQADRIAIEKPLRDFITGHTKAANLGILLDSASYESQDETSKASNVRQWEVELLKGQTSGLSDVATAISRVNRELARILGVEQLLLGEASAGSFALSKDKTQSFFLLIDGTLRELTETVQNDLVDVIWHLNGWDPEDKPTLTTEAVRYQDIEQITAALRDMAAAGAVLEPDDEAIGEVRDLLGLSRPPERLHELVEAGLIGTGALVDPNNPQNQGNPGSVRGQQEPPNPDDPMNDDPTSNG